MKLTSTLSEHVFRRGVRPRRAEPPRRAKPALNPPCRSEAFAEDLAEPMDRLRVHAPHKQRRATLLFVVPLGAALLGSVLPILSQVV